MHLKTVTLRNFRSFEEGEVVLQSDLTVFVGENNGGKSNAIDAIRLLTQPLGGRREIYCEPTDVRFQSDMSGFELEAHFKDLNPGQQGRLISATTDLSLSEARFGLRYGGREGTRPELWAGRPGNTPEPGCQDMVRHVYLPPLRDAKRALASGNPTRIMALLSHFLGERSAADLARDLARQAKHDVLSQVDGAVGKGLSALTAGVRPQTATLGFASHEALIDIARDLQFKLADHGVHPEDLRYSGHGYANLLFMATIAVELEKVRKSDLTLFLVEEPEAHLHPQLQAAVLAFLNDQAEQSRTDPSAQGPAGQVQVIVASHSPNLSAWVSSKQLVVFKSAITAKSERREAAGPGEAPASIPDPAAADAVIATPIHKQGLQDPDPDPDPDPAESLATAATAAAIRRSTRCIPLDAIPLTAGARRKVDRYLDVTKAALLFGGRVILVEGIAESLLLPVIAEHHTLKDVPEKLRLLRSAVFVAIDGVDFEPYVNLLTAAVGDARIVERLVVMTDGDRATASHVEIVADEEQGPDGEPDAAPTSAPTEGTLTPGERRKAALDALVERNGAKAFVEVISSIYSLESELVEAGNAEIMRAAYTKLYPRSGAKWDGAVRLEHDARAKAIQDLFKDTRKGDFAQVLAGLIEEGELTFNVPPYIEMAILGVAA